MKFLWFVPEKQGGIFTYARDLWPAVREKAREVGYFPEEPLYMDFSEKDRWGDEISQRSPDLIHIQHEFGLFGSKVPPFYQFPGFLEELRLRFPQAKIAATAHTVLGRDYLYKTSGQGFKMALRWAANHTVVPWMRQLWMERTWGGLDGIIVHSKLQTEAIVESGCKRVKVIPHFVSDRYPAMARVARETHPVLSRIAADEKVVLVFGFVTPEKGQDIAIEALRAIPSNQRPLLLIGGDARRSADQSYQKRCQQRVEELGLAERVIFTGFLAEEMLDQFFVRADLVLAPFRESSGSGSLAHAFSRGCAVLASDLDLNREIAQRQKDALALFKTENPVDCANQIISLLNESDLRKQLKQNAMSYAHLCNPKNIAEKHLNFYKELLA